MLIETLKQARRVSIAVIGFTILILGVAMLVLPGPGWLIILLGLSILSVEFVWARRLMRRVRRAGRAISRTVFGETKTAASEPKG